MGSHHRAAPPTCGCRWATSTSFRRTTTRPWRLIRCRSPCGFGDLGLGAQLALDLRWFMMKKEAVDGTAHRDGAHPSTTTMSRSPQSCTHGMYLTHHVHRSPLQRWDAGTSGCGLLTRAARKQEMLITRPTPLGILLGRKGLRSCCHPTQPMFVALVSGAKLCFGGGRTA